MTKDQWYNHPSLRQDLTAILENPVLINALEIVKDQGVKATMFPSTPVDLIQFFALMGAKRDGYIEALTNLHLLTQPQVEHKATPEAWTTPKEPQPKT